MDSPPSCSGVEDDRRSQESDSPDSDDLDRNPPEAPTSSKVATSMQAGDLETSADLNSDDSNEDEPPPIRRNLFSNTASSRPLPSTPRLKPVELASQDKSSSPPPPLAFPPLPSDDDDDEQQQHQVQPPVATRANSSSSSSSSASSSSTTEVPPASNRRRRYPTTPPRPRPTQHILADWARDHTPFRALQDAVMQGRAVDNQIEYYWQLVQEVTDEEAVRAAKEQEAWVEAGLAEGEGEMDEGGTERRRDEDEEGDEVMPKNGYGGKLDEWYARYQRGETSTGEAGHVKSLPWDGDEVMEDARDSHARERCSTPGPEGERGEEVHGRGAKTEEDQNDNNDRTYNPFRQKSSAKRALAVDEHFGQDDDTKPLGEEGNSKGDEMDWQSSSEEGNNNDKAELQRRSRRASGSRILEGLMSRAQTRSKKLQEVQAKEDEDGEQRQREGSGMNWSQQLKLRIGLGGAAQDGRTLGEEGGREVVESVEGDGRVDGDLE